MGFEVKPYRLVLLAFQILLFAMSSSPSSKPDVFDNDFVNIVLSMNMKGHGMKTLG